MNERVIYIIALAFCIFIASISMSLYTEVNAENNRLSSVEVESVYNTDSSLFVNGAINELSVLGSDIVEVMSNESESVSIKAVEVVDNRSPYEVLNLSPVDYSQMTKSKIVNKLEQFQTMIDSLEYAEMTNSPIYQYFVSEYESGKYAIDNNQYLYPYSEGDLKVLAYAITFEVGADYCPDEEQCSVGAVILNRKNMGGMGHKFENATFLDVINQPGQYSPLQYDPELGYNRIRLGYNETTGQVTKKDNVTGAVWNAGFDTVVKPRAIENARKVLEHEFELPENVIYQSAGKQGTGVYSTYVHFDNTPSKVTTYFCYGNVERGY